MYYPSFEYNSGTIGLKSCRVNETSDVAHYSKSSLSAFASTTTQTISSSEIASITHVEPSTISPSSIMQPFITASAIQSTGFLITERSTMTMATPSFIIKETILVEVAASISNFTRPLATSTASVVVSSITPFSMTLTTPFLSATPSSSQTSKELSMNVVASAAIPKLQNKKRELSILVYEELEAQAFSSLLLTPSQTFQLSTTPQDTTTFSSVTEPTLTTGIQSFSSILPTVISFTNNLFRRQVKKSLNYLSAIEQVSVQLKTTHSVEKYVKITKPTRSSDKVVSETPQTTNVTKKEQNKKVGTSRTSQDQKVNATKVDKVKESAHTIEMITATATRTTSIKTPMSSTGVPVFQVFFTKVFEHKESPRN